jgi:hypothetical protein
MNAISFRREKTRRWPFGAQETPSAAPIRIARRPANDVTQRIGSAFGRRGTKYANRRPSGESRGLNALRTNLLASEPSAAAIQTEVS